MVVEGFHGNRGLVPTSPSVRLPISPCPPRDGHPVSDAEEVDLMEVVHTRCAGLDVSKKDAKQGRA